MSINADTPLINDSKEADILECISSFLFLRTYSLQLQLSPFEFISFVSCLSVTSNHNPLFDEISCTLMRACIHNIKEELPECLNWQLLDRFTYSEYITSLLSQYELLFRREQGKFDEEDTTEINEISEVLKLLRYSNDFGINITGICLNGKNLVLKCLISLLLSDRTFRKLLDYRGDIEQDGCNTTDETESADIDNEKGDSLPLFPKGDDGYPEVYSFSLNSIVVKIEFHHFIFILILHLFQKSIGMHSMWCRRRFIMLC